MRQRLARRAGGVLETVWDADPRLTHRLGQLAIAFEVATSDLLGARDELLDWARVIPFTVGKAMAGDRGTQVARSDREYQAIRVRGAPVCDLDGENLDGALHIFTIISTVSWAHTALRLQTNRGPRRPITTTMEGLAPRHPCRMGSVGEGDQLRVRCVAPNGSLVTPEAAADGVLVEEAPSRLTGLRTL